MFLLFLLMVTLNIKFNKAPPSNNTTHTLYLFRHPAQINYFSFAISKTNNANTPKRIKAPILSMNERDNQFQAKTAKKIAANLCQELNTEMNQLNATLIPFHTALKIFAITSNTFSYHFCSFIISPLTCKHSSSNYSCPYSVRTNSRLCYISGFYNLTTHFPNLFFLVPSCFIIKIQT